MKEITYFSNDKEYCRGEAFLRYYYHRHNDGQLMGMSDVQLMFFEYVPERLYQYNPSLKLIAVLRNPIDRAYSAYWYARQNGIERAKTFEEAIHNDRDNSTQDFFRRCHFAYLEHGHYSEQIKRLLDIFPRDQIHILLTEDLRQPADYWIKIMQYLNLDPEQDRIDFSQKFNQTSMPKYLWLQRLIASPHLQFMKLYREKVPRVLRHFITQTIVERIYKKNLVPFKYPPMNQKTRQKLRKYFAPHNTSLANLIERDLSHWR
jgi:hypothetical protein